MTAPAPERWVNLVMTAISEFRWQDDGLTDEEWAGFVLAPVLADLRAQVQALRDESNPALGWVRVAALDDVLALLDGGGS